MSEEIKAKMKACFPDGLEAIMITKDDYDRLCGDLTYRNVELEQENQQLKENNQSYQEEMCRSWEKVDKYKSILDEIREYCMKGYPYVENASHDILQILDKVNPSE